MVDTEAEPPLGLRERKRRETRQRIIEAGVCLFLANGIDATTLDEIAAAAGISRRTFFHYFQSKDEILISFQHGMGEAIAERVRHADRAATPLGAIRTAVILTCAEIPAEDMLSLDRLMRSSPGVQARKQASYVEHERTLVAALQERWPDPSREMALRLVAMLAIGAIRLATEALSVAGEQRTLVELLEDAFSALTDELSGAAAGEGTASLRV